MFTVNTDTKTASTDRIIYLEPMEGKSAKDTQGRVDPKLFTGENKIHAVMDDETCHWSIRYECGATPEPLKQRFTSFKMLVQFVESYFKTRNVKIKEISK